MNLRPLLFLAFLASGCGKPPSGGGGPPPGEYPTACVVAQVTRGELVDGLRLVGTVAAKESARLISEADGEISLLNFEEGARIREGDVLFELDKAKAEARLLDAQTSQKLALTEFSRAQDLWQQKAITKREYDQAESAVGRAQAQLTLAQEDLKDTIIQAPFDGVAGSRHVSRGQFVSRGTLLAELYAMDPIEVEFSAPERFAARIKEGQKAAITASAWPDQPLTAEVVFINPQVDPVSRSLRVKARLPNAEGKLRPGMFVSVVLEFNRRPNALLIPEAALLRNARGSVVVKLNADSRAEFTPVVTGLVQDGQLEILEGLKDGDLIVVEGHQKLGPDKLIGIAPESERYGVQPPPPPSAVESSDETQAPAPGSEPTGNPGE